MRECDCDKEAAERATRRDKAKKGLCLGGKHRGLHDQHTNISSPEYFFLYVTEHKPEVLSLAIPMTL